MSCGWPIATDVRAADCRWRHEVAEIARENLGHAALTLDEIRDRHIMRVLAATGGHVSGAAVVLGMRRQTLQRILRRLGVAPGGRLLSKPTALGDADDMADLITNGEAELSKVTNPSPLLVFPESTAPIADQNTLAGSPVCVSTAGHAALARANAAGTAFCIGIAQQFALSGAPVYARYVGPVELTTAEWDAIAGTSGGLTTGATYYLSSTSAGKLTSVAPSASGSFVVAVGVATSRTTLLVGQHVPIGPHA